MSTNLYLQKRSRLYHNRQIVVWAVWCMSWMALRLKDRDSTKMWIKWKKTEMVDLSVILKVVSVSKTLLCCMRTTRFPFSSQNCQIRTPLWCIMTGHSSQEHLSHLTFWVTRLKECWPNYNVLPGNGMCLQILISPIFNSFCLYLGSSVQKTLICMCSFVLGEICAFLLVENCPTQLSPTPKGSNLNGLWLTPTPP